jgi:hypothetical protein
MIIVDDVNGPLSSYITSMEGQPAYLPGGYEDKAFRQGSSTQGNSVGPI